MTTFLCSTPAQLEPVVQVLEELCDPQSQPGVSTLTFTLRSRYSVSKNSFSRQNSSYRYVDVKVEGEIPRPETLWLPYLEEHHLSAVPIKELTGRVIKKYPVPAEKEWHFVDMPLELFVVLIGNLVERGVPGPEGVYFWHSGSYWPSGYVDLS